MIIIYGTTCNVSAIDLHEKLKQLVTFLIFNSIVYNFNIYFSICIMETLFFNDNGLLKFTRDLNT